MVILSYKIKITKEKVPTNAKKYSKYTGVCVEQMHIAGFPSCHRPSLSQAQFVTGPVCHSAQFVTGPVCHSAQFVTVGRLLWQSTSGPVTCFRRWGDLRADPNPNPRGCAQALCAACVTHNMQKALWYPTGTVSKEMEFLYKIVC